MKNKLIYLLKVSRRAYEKKCWIIKYDKTENKVIDIYETSFLDNLLDNFSGFFYDFYDWGKNKKQLILFYEDNNLYVSYENEVTKINSVKTKKIFFWKKIIVNNNLVIKVYSPLYTLFLITDQFPDEVEPIYSQFLYLSGKNAINEQIEFFKDKLSS